MLENTTPSTELPRDLCAGIGPLQLGVVLVRFLFIAKNARYRFFWISTIAAETGVKYMRILIFSSEELLPVYIYLNVKVVDLLY